MLNQLVRWFQTRPVWLRGGFFGVALCTVLFIFYIGLYFPFLQFAYQDQLESDGTMPGWTTNIPMVTGHLFPLLSEFVFDVTLVCEETETVCSSWDIDNGCTQQEQVISESCRGKADLIGFLSFTIGLEAIYFVLGSVGNVLLHKRKKL